MIDVREPFSTFTRAPLASGIGRKIHNPYDGFLHLVCLQHQQNFRLWHQEDIARSPDVTDADLAAVKRTIDKLNQQRNDLIERLDDCLIQRVVGVGRAALSGAPAEHRNARQRHRPAFDPRAAALPHGGASLPQRRRPHAPRPRPGWKFSTSSVSICPVAAPSCADIFAGRKRLKVYRQFKMYYDATMNPYLYGVKPPAA